MINYGHINHADSHPVAFARAREKAKADGKRGAFGPKPKIWAFVALSQRAAIVIASVRRAKQLWNREFYAGKFDAPAQKRTSNGRYGPDVQPQKPVNPWILKLRAKREKARAIKAAEEAKTLADSILPA